LGAHLLVHQHSHQDAIFGIDSKTPLELFEARNAMRIARIALPTNMLPSSSRKPASS